MTTLTEPELDKLLHWDTNSNLSCGRFGVVGSVDNTLMEGEFVWTNYLPKDQPTNLYTSTTSYENACALLLKSVKASLRLLLIEP